MVPILQHLWLANPTRNGSTVLKSTGEIVYTCRSSDPVTSLLLPTQITVGTAFSKSFRFLVSSLPDPLPVSHHPQPALHLLTPNLNCAGCATQHHLICGRNAPQAAEDPDPRTGEASRTTVWRWKEVCQGPVSGRVTLPKRVQRPECTVQIRLCALEEQLATFAVELPRSMSEDSLVRASTYNCMKTRCT